MDDIRSGVTLEQIIEKHGKQLQYPKMVKCDMFNIVADYGIIIQSLSYYDIAPTIASLARQYNAFAVVSDKLALMFYKGKYRFWRSHNLNIETLKGQEYNRHHFYEHLNLTQNQYATISLLLGQNNVRYSVLEVSICTFSLLRMCLH